MKRSQIKANPETAKAWQERSRETARNREPKPRKSVKRVSPKGTVRATLYRAARAAFMVLHPNCQRCEKGGIERPATQLHHICGREGDNLTDPEGFAAVCTPCHTWIHHHIAAATKAGWLGTKHHKRDQ